MTRNEIIACLKAVEERTGRAALVDDRMGAFGVALSRVLELSQDFERQDLVSGMRPREHLPVHSGFSSSMGMSSGGTWRLISFFRDGRKLVA